MHGFLLNLSLEFLRESKIEVAEMKFIGIIQECVKSDKIKI